MQFFMYFRIHYSFLSYKCQRVQTWPVREKTKSVPKLGVDVAKIVINFVVCVLGVSYRKPIQVIQIILIGTVTWHINHATYLTLPKLCPDKYTLTFYECFAILSLVRCLPFPTEKNKLQ